MNAAGIGGTAGTLVPFGLVARPLEMAERLKIGSGIESLEAVAPARWENVVRLWLDPGAEGLGVIAGVIAGVMAGERKGSPGVVVHDSKASSSPSVSVSLPL